MNKKLSFSILIICANLIGVTSAITPASALIKEVAKIPKQEQPKEQPKEPVSEILKPQEQPKEQSKELISEILKSEIPSESDVKAQVKSDVDIIQGTLESETEHINNLAIKEGVDNTLEGTTDTKILDKAGATSDETIHTAVIDPTKESPSLNPLIEKTGNGTTLEITQDSNGIDVHVDSDEHIKVGNVAKVDICLDVNAKVGGSAEPSLANCAKKSQAVPEPTTIGGLFLMGGYLISRRRKVSQL